MVTGSIFSSIILRFKQCDRRSELLLCASLLVGHAKPSLEWVTEGTLVSTFPPSGIWGIRKDIKKRNTCTICFSFGPPPPPPRIKILTRPHFCLSYYAMRPVNFRNSFFFSRYNTLSVRYCS